MGIKEAISNYLTPSVEIQDSHIRFENDRLVGLDLRGMRIQQIDGALFDEFTTIRNIFLQNNEIKVIPDLSRLSELKGINLADNNISSIDEDQFINNRNITYINLSNNNLTEIPAGLFRNNTDLELLYLHGNTILYLDEKLFETVKSLKTLNISNNNLTEFPITILYNIKLDELYMSNNHFDGAFDYTKKLDLVRLFNTKRDELGLELISINVADYKIDLEAPCPHCNERKGYDRIITKSDSVFYMQNYYFVHFICKSCKFVKTFYEGNLYTL